MPLMTRPAALPRSLRRPFHRHALAAVIALFPLGALADTPLRIDAVILSTAGMALVESRGTLGNGPLALEVPRDRIDDLLKTLMIRDPAAAPARVTLPGPGLLEDLFRHLPVSPGDTEDRSRLLAALDGAPITVTREGGRWSGLNMGVSDGTCGAERCTLLNLMAEDGRMRQFRLDDGVEISLDDADDRRMLQSALQARRQGEHGPLRVLIHSDDDSARDIGLAWMQEAPVWQTAWRAVDGPEGLRLTGWAIIENATGHDWQDIRLTLATGAARSLRAPLYARIMPEREEIAPAAEEPAFAALMERDAVRAPGSAMAAPPPPAVAVEADDSAAFSRFTLADAVSLPAGEMLMIPLLDTALPDARLTLYRGGSGMPHPDIALDLENPLPLRLPAGVLTLYEDGRGHAGDAMIPELAPGARAVVPFARDSAISVREETTSTELLREITLVGGILQVREDIERRTAYRIEGAPQADRVLSIEHPRRDGWTVVAPEGGEERLDGWRWQIDLPAGAQASHVVRERQPRLRRIAVMDLDLPALAAWEARSDDPALQQRLAEIGALRRQITGAERGAAQARARIDDLREDQDRLVNLIVQLGEGSAATPERRERVDALDAEIDAARSNVAALETEAREARAALEALLGG